jgi:undecaprenyl phosphate-alpha-L-ara4FN deformylase
MNIGLRIDVDTLRGTREGVPSLLRALARHGIRATWFFSVGPDNMGRHIWRLLRPAFALKMLRSRAASLYGWDILLRGTFWPGPRIAARCGQILRDVVRDGHELGYHAWDHHAWQARADRWTEPDVRAELERGLAALAEAAGAPAVCTAAPGWRCTPAALLAKNRLGFRFHSDCRGQSLFRPVQDGTALNHVQVPVTLPTYDELVGRAGVTAETYNDALIAALKPDRLNVLTIHAEAEGLACRGLFDAFLDKTLAAGWGYVPLGTLVGQAGTVPRGRLARGSVPGREGWVAVQEAEGSGQ